MLSQKMVKTYKVITAKKEKEIEDTINELVKEGWKVEKFGYAFKGKTAESHYWALMLKEK
jgi:hypothetical protein